MRSPPPPQGGERLPGCVALSADASEPESAAPGPGEKARFGW